MISSRIVLLVCLLSMGGLLFGGTITSVPIADQKADGFWSLQFRGVSFDASGENVALTLWVNTGDSAANGAITVTNTDTSTVVFSQNYWNTSGYFGLQYLDDVAAFHLSPGNYSVTLTAREFSRASVIYGNEVKAAWGAWDQQGDPSFTTAFAIDTPEPTSIALISFGLTALGLYRGRLRRSWLQHSK